MIIILVGRLVFVVDYYVWINWVLVKIGNFEWVFGVGEIDDGDVVLVLGLYEDIVFWYRNDRVVVCYVVFFFGLG